MTILLAKGDNTAIRFRDAYGRTADRSRKKSDRGLDTTSHSFAAVADKQWLVRNRIPESPP